MSTVNASPEHTPLRLADPSSQNAIGPILSALLVLAADLLAIGAVLWAFLGNNHRARRCPGGLPFWPLCHSS